MGYANAISKRYNRFLQNGGHIAMILKEYTVSLYWDMEASVWIAVGDDITGLLLESDNKDVLMERVKLAVPDLLELNSYCKEPYVLRFVQREGGLPD